MKKISAAAVLIVLVACSDAPEPAPASSAETQSAAPTPEPPASKYIGLEHSMSIAAIAMGAIDLPDSLAVESVLFLDNPAFVGAGPHNSLTRVQGRQSSMVWLEEMVRRESDGVTLWRVAGVLDLPAVTEQQAIIVSKDCRAGERPDPNLVAIAQREATPGPWYTNIQQAWRANLATRSFDKVETSGLRCPTS
jgi:hypothetical protein